MSINKEGDIQKGDVIMWAAFGAAIGSIVSGVIELMIKLAFVWGCK